MPCLQIICVLQFDYGDDESQGSVDKLMPKKVKKRRKVTAEDGVSIRLSRD